MRCVRLIAASDEYDSDPGLVLKGTPTFEDLMADRDGLLIAHDLLEHQNGTANMGTVWDELEAIGGIWQVRGRHGDLMQKTGSMYSVVENVASDVTRMFSDWPADGWPPPEHRLRATRPHLYDEDFEEIIAVARRDIPREHNDMGRGEPGEDENGWSPELHLMFEEYLTEALHRIRTGFRKAERRFGPDYGGYNLFRSVRDAARSATRMIDYEGQEFVLSYGNGEASCRPIYFEEDDYR